MADGKRVRVRNPALVEGFCGRFRQVLAATGVRQRQLASQMGDVSPQVISRLVSGESQTIALDLLVQLIGWVDNKGISPQWLLLGFGAMKKADIPREPPVVDAMNRLTETRMIIELARRAGIDLSDVIDDSVVASYAPGQGILTVPMRDVLARLDEQIGKSPREKKVRK